MPTTNIRGGRQVLDGSIQKADLDITTTGQAVVTKVVQGANVVLTSTGADSGTGDVTISVPGGGTGPAGANAFTTTTTDFSVPSVGSTVVVNVVDASWVVVGQMVYVQGAGPLRVQSKAGNQVTLLNQ